MWPLMHYSQLASIQNHVDDSHVDDTHVDDTHVDDTHVDDTHVDDTHVDDAHVDDAHALCYKWMRCSVGRSCRTIRGCNWVLSTTESM